MRKLTQEEFIRRAKEVHGDKYDYSKVEYANTNTKVCIICPTHGEFWQLPIPHFKGAGCTKCGRERICKQIYGVGINDVREYDANLYRKWWAMLARCYKTNNNDTKEREHPIVCDEWHRLSNFQKWYNEHNVDGWHLDKDILIKGNKLYSPETCCFVPPEINTLFTKRQNCRGGLPIGVTSRGNRFEASLHREDRRVYLGCYSTPKEAFAAYKEAKETWIKELADKYKGELEPCVYMALCNYKVEITD